MGNKMRRTSKKALPLTSNQTPCPVSSDSFGISLKTVTKSTSNEIAANNKTLNGEVRIWAEKMADTGLGDTKKEVGEQLSHLRYLSWNRTLLETPSYQGTDWKPKEKPAVSAPKALSAKASDFVPSEGHVKQIYLHGGTIPSNSKQSPTRQRGQHGRCGATRHLMYRNQHAKPPPGVDKIQSLIQKLQIFPPFVHNCHSKHISDSSSYTENSSGGVSTATAFTTPTPHTERYVDFYLETKYKDIVIDAHAVRRNRINNCLQVLQPNGRYIVESPSGLKPGNVLNELALLDEGAKKRYWETNVVEIEVDLREIPTTIAEEKKKNEMYKEIIPFNKGKGKEAVVKIPVMDQIARLGPDFFAYATTIQISIHFPAPRDGSPAPQPQSIAKKHGDWIYPDRAISIHTPGFAILEKLRVELDKIVHLSSLDIVLHNATASTTVPFTLEQLYYALPFYDLEFQDWQLKWQGNYMSEAVGVGHFPIILLDKERNKWLWEKQKADQEKIRQARIAREEYEKRLGEPLGPPRLSGFVDEEGRPLLPFPIAPMRRASPKPAPMVTVRTVAPKQVTKTSPPKPAVHPPTTPTFSFQPAPAAMPEVDPVAIPLPEKSHGIRAEKRERERARRGI